MDLKLLLFVSELKKNKGCWFNVTALITFIQILDKMRYILRYILKTLCIFSILGEVVSWIWMHKLIGNKILKAMEGIYSCQ